MQIYLWVAIILLNFISIAYCIKISIEFNKMVDENIKLLEENMVLRLENLSYETTCDTLMKSNISMKINEDKNAKMVKISKVNVPTVKRGRPRKTDK